jgi:CRISPR-associated protein (TIGR03986 family)
MGSAFEEAMKKAAAEKAKKSVGTEDATAKLISERVKKVEDNKKKEAEQRSKAEATKKAYGNYLKDGYSGNRYPYSHVSNVFVNPYAFYPIEDAAPDRKLRSNMDMFSQDSLTGVLECSLEIHEKSPLFIPNTTKTFTQGEHKCYDFFSYENLMDYQGAANPLPASPPDKPVIPGSEIRGVVRSVYEQLTNSCLPIIDENNWPYKRSALPKTPYLMVKDSKGDWQLHQDPVIYKLKEPHKSRVDETRDNYKSYRPVENGKPHTKSSKTVSYVTKIQLDTDGNLLVHGTGPMPKKHITLFDLEKSKEKKVIEWSKRIEALERFEKVIKNYCEGGTEKNAKDAAAIYEAYENRYKQGLPILVYADETLTYLSPACMTKEYFENTIDKILEKQYAHNRCSGEQGYCPACRLFGAIGDKGQDSVGSRVRFADSHEASGCENGWQIKTLPILSSPRISATEFYLRRPNEKAHTWNYDYYVDRDNNTIPYQPLLRGRKVYWNFPYDRDAIVPDNNMNNTVRLLTAGTFKFKVYFDDVLAEELSDLMFAIGGRGEGRLQKLGHGKPAGLGSVRMKVDNVTVRKYESRSGKILFSNEICWQGEVDPGDDTPIARRRLIEHFGCWLGDAAVDGETLGDKISYPKPQAGPLAEGNLTYEWFKRNRGSVQKPKIDQELDCRTLKDEEESLQEEREAEEALLV